MTSISYLYLHIIFINIFINSCLSSSQELLLLGNDIILWRVHVPSVQSSHDTVFPPHPILHSQNVDIAKVNIFNEWEKKNFINCPKRFNMIMMIELIFKSFLLSFALLLN